MKTVLLTLVFLAVAWLATGCVTPIVDYSKLSKEQIEALGKDKTAVGVCITANTPYGKGITTYLAIDKSVLKAEGSVTINDQCMMTFNEGKK